MKPIEHDSSREPPRPNLSAIARWPGPTGRLAVLGPMATIALWIGLALLPSPPLLPRANSLVPLAAEGPCDPRHTPSAPSARLARAVRAGEPASQRVPEATGAAPACASLADEPYAALEALAAAGDHRGLAESLAVDRERSQRFMAVKLLRELATPQAAAALESCALGSGEFLVRSAALHGYHAIVGVEAVDMLQRVLWRADQRDLHPAVLRLLGRTRSREALDALVAHIPRSGSSGDLHALAHGLARHEATAPERVHGRLDELAALAPRDLDLRAALAPRDLRRHPARRGR